MLRPATLATLAVVAAAAPAAAQARATKSLPPVAVVQRVDTAVFAGGCFWGIEGVFEHVKGVLSATSGFSGGTKTSPSYEEVSTSSTGHAESVQVIYDPSRVNYRQLLEVFFAVHDPTELNRQGPDEGTQYRSAVFYRNAAQHQAAAAYVGELTRAKQFASPIVTEIVALKAFYAAEGYHQHYMALHPDSPYIAYNDAPKLTVLKQRFPDLYYEPGGVWGTR